MKGKKYTVTAVECPKGPERAYEFHDTQRVIIDKKGAEITKLLIYAHAPDFESLGSLSVTIYGKGAKTYRVGRLYDCVSELRTAFNELEAAVVSHFIQGKELHFRENLGESPSTLEFEGEPKQEGRVK